MLKETKKSLRGYFGVVAGLSFLSHVVAICNSGGAVLPIVFATVGIVISAFYLHITIAFPRLIADKPGFIKKTLVAGTAFALARLLASIPSGDAKELVLPTIIGIVVLVYLMKSVDRLSAQPAETSEKVKPPEPGADPNTAKTGA